jgi:hypothetical protein
MQESSVCDSDGYETMSSLQMERKAGNTVIRHDFK